MASLCKQLTDTDMIEKILAVRISLIVYVCAFMQTCLCMFDLCIISLG